jgi:para-nitrobenzyl esterase
MALLEAKTRYGVVKGLPTGYQASTSFKGIPYAAAPVGNLRWKAPQAPQPWSEPLEAYSYGPIPFQTRPAEGTFYRKEFYPIEWPCSEDCLYLNVITPAESADEKLPIALWVYGGGFTQGYSQKIETDGEAFAQEGVIYVSFNYRVNAFGYLSCPTLDAETDGELSGNYGLMDQIAALNWVYENISAFGGDPERITVFGQSAGAMSVYHLLCSPLTKGKIAGAIMESGGGPAPELYNTEEIRDYSKRFLHSLGCTSVDEMRSISGQDLYAKWVGFTANNQPPALPLHPVPGGIGVPSDLVKLFQSGGIPDIPCMIGSMANEDTTFTPDGSEGNFNMRNNFMSGVLAFCEKQSEPGRKPSFMYHVTNVPPGEPCRGAFHSSEHMYIFKTLLRSWRPYTGKDFDFANIMCGYWTNFIKTGNPNGEGLPKWNEYTAEAKQCMKLDREGCEMINVPIYDGVARCQAEAVLGRSI